MLSAASYNRDSSCIHKTLDVRELTRRILATSSVVSRANMGQM